MDLSLCMIVKNEEAALPRCLSSVRAVVDEIIILDTGSTDRTPEIAKEFGAQVYFFAWPNNFAIARNESLKHAQGEWILVLDADEVLVANIAPKLKQAIQNPSQLLINLIRQEVGADQSPYSLVSRLFRNRPDICFSRPYHAMVDESVAQILSQEPQLQVGYLPDVAILHEGYQPGAISGRDKFAKAQAAMEGFLADHSNEPYVCSKLGALYVQAGELARGVELLQQGLSSVGELEIGKSALPQQNAPILYELHYHLGIAYSRSLDSIGAEGHYQAAIQQPIPPKLKLGAYNNLANLLKAKGDLVEARAVYQQALQIDPAFAPGYYNLGMTLKASGDFKAAIAAYKQAIQFNPTYAEAYQNLGVVLLKIGDVPASLSAFRQAIVLYEPHHPLEAERLRQGLSEIGFEL